MAHSSLAGRCAAAPNTNPAPTPRVPNTPGSSHDKGRRGRKVYDAVATKSPPSATSTLSSSSARSSSWNRRSGLTRSLAAAASASISASRAASRARNSASQALRSRFAPPACSASAHRNPPASACTPMSGRRFLRSSRASRLTAISVAVRGMWRP